MLTPIKHRKWNLTVEWVSHEPKQLQPKAVGMWAHVPLWAHASDSSAQESNSKTERLVLTLHSLRHELQMTPLLCLENLARSQDRERGVFLF